MHLRTRRAKRMLRGIIANDPRSPRPEKHGNPRNKPRRLAAALATILVIVLALHNTQVDAGPSTKLEFTTCEAPTTTHNRTTRRVVGAACSTNDVDAGDCVRDTTRWSTRYRCLPSFVIGGAQKAATGSLAAWLQNHPYLRRGIGSNGHPGEVHYFDAFPKNASLVDLETTWRSYAERFPALSENEVRTGVLTYEKSPSYLRFGQAPRLLASLLPSCAWIIILRDPVDRAYSAFAHHIRHGRFGVVNDRVHTIEQRGCPDQRLKVWRLTPTKYVDTCMKPDRIRILRGASDPSKFDVYVRRDTVASHDAPVVVERWNGGGPLDVVRDGAYASQFVQLYEFVDRSRVHVLFFEDVVTDPAGVLDKLQTALGLPSFEFAPRDLVVTKSRSRPPMLTETRAFLRAFYAPSLASLRRVLGRDLPEAWL